MSAQAHLSRSRAGMRLIALLTLYNQGDAARLRAYIADNYEPQALEDQSVEDLLADLLTLREQIGRVRIAQVLGVGEHQAVVMGEGEQGAWCAFQMAVSEAYPHRVIYYVHQPVDVDDDD